MDAAPHFATAPALAAPADFLDSLIWAQGQDAIAAAVVEAGDAEWIGSRPEIGALADRRDGARDDRCPRCEGRGVIHAYHYVQGGRCFRCGGAGVRG